MAEKIPNLPGNDPQSQFERQSREAALGAPSASIREEESRKAARKASLLTGAGGDESETAGFQEDFMASQAEEEAAQELEAQKANDRLARMRAQVAAKKLQPESPLKTRAAVLKDTPLDAMIIGLLVFKDTFFDFIFFGIDLNIFGAVFGVLFLVFVTSIRYFQSSKKQSNWGFKALMYLILFLECIPIIAAAVFSSALMAWLLNVERNAILAKSKLSGVAKNVVK